MQIVIAAGQSQFQLLQTILITLRQITSYVYLNRFKVIVWHYMYPDPLLISLPHAHNPHL